MSFISVFIFIFGLIIGSFLNSVIFRLYKNNGIYPSALGGKGRTRSYCFSCNKTIAWYDNIPVLSYLNLKGKCRQCKDKISSQYPIVELATGLLFVLSFHVFLNTSPNLDILFLFKSLFVVSVMMIILVFDMRWFLIPNSVILPSIVIIFLVNIFLGFTWYIILLSGIVSALFFLLQYIATKRKGIGEGDIWLGLLIGIIFANFYHLLGVLFIAYILGSIVGLTAMLFRKKKWGSKLPLGVFLSIATIVSLFYIESIINWYFSLF